MSHELIDYEFDVADFDADEREQLNDVFGLDKLARALPECSRCTGTPTDRDDLLMWAVDGSWGAFYEDNSFGGFCPSCDEFVGGPD